jgi:hypothetical protein
MNAHDNRKQREKYTLLVRVGADHTFIAMPVNQITDIRCNNNNCYNCKGHISR